jgi:GNAT superfamily N-acetyltransferase
MMVEGLRIRAAKEGDVEAMLALLHALFSIEADFSFDPDKQARGLMRLLSRGDAAQVMVAEHAGSIVGMCTLQCLISTAEGGEVGLVEDMVIDEAWRGRGIGRRLLEAMEDWARTRGLSRLQLLADRHNRPAFAFYEALGWSGTQLLALRKHLHLP